MLRFVRVAIDDNIISQSVLDAVLVKSHSCVCSTYRYNFGEDKISFIHILLVSSNNGISVKNSPQLGYKSSYLKNGSVKIKVSDRQCMVVELRMYCGEIFKELFETYVTLLRCIFETYVTLLRCIFETYVTLLRCIFEIYVTLLRCIFETYVTLLRCIFVQQEGKFNL